VGKLAINPNTVLKAYRELDHERLVEGRRGQGTFVSRQLAPYEPAKHAALRSSLQRWIERAQAAGFDEDGVAALFAAVAGAAFVEKDVA
jgi:GntR family transcriptional regulator